VVLITGGSAGIGLATAIEFAKLNGHIIIACRKSTRASEAIDLVKSKSGNEKVDMMELDLTSLASVCKFVKEFKKRNIPLHILINNAGVSGVLPRKLTQDGFEMNFGLNYLAPFLLTNLLIDKVQESKGRIVNVSSNTHDEISSIDFDNLQMEKGYQYQKAYAQSKLAILLFTKELQRRVNGVSVFAINPGFVLTELSYNYMAAQAGKRVADFVTSCQKLLCKTPFQGAQVYLYAAISPSLEGKGGLYIENCEITSPSKLGLDPDIAAKLWNISAQLVDLDNKLKK